MNYVEKVLKPSTVELLKCILEQNERYPALYITLQRE